MCKMRENTNKNFSPGGQIQKIMINEAKFAFFGPAISDVASMNGYITGAISKKIPIVF